MKKKPKKKAVRIRRTRAAKQINEPLKEALGLRQRDYWLIPVPPKSKKLTRKGWNEERHDEAALARKIRPDSNIGLLLGTDPEPVVDVDLDCAEAIEVAEFFLPNTEMKFGRRSAPKSHWIYSCADLKTTKFLDPLRTSVKDEDRTMILELRSKGAQTIVPPSRHPSGEQIEWDERSEPAAVESKHLVRCAVLIASTSLLGRYWPAKGQRHEAALALAGFLLQSGIEPEDVENVVELAADLAEDEEAEERVADVRSTVRKLKAGEPVTGRSKLTEFVDSAVVDQVAKWLRACGASDTSDASDTSSPSRKFSPNHADVLVDLVCKDLNAELFRAPGRDPGAFATLNTPTGRLTFSIGSKRFHQLVGTQGRERLGRVCSGKIIEEAVAQLEGDAIYSGVSHDVHVRVAKVGDVVFLDLAASDSSVIEVTPDRWSVLPQSPVRFIQPNTALPLPLPTSGGDLDELMSLVNVRDPEDQLLLQVWLTAVFLPDVPCPPLFIHGEQGSAKTTLTRFLHSLVDPSSTMLRQPPKDLHQLAIAADNARILSFDNLSSIKQNDSDAYCKLVTGAAFPVRKFYNDGEERVFSGKRALILNGIPDLARFPDLLGRAITFVLPRIEGTARRTERELESAFENARPRILGALLDVVSKGLRAARDEGALPVELDRMADFCEWGVTVAPALGASSDDFVEALARNRRTSDQGTIEASPIVQPLKQYLLNNGRVFEGTATDLLRRLDGCDLVEETYRRRRDWPRSPHALGRLLRREAPAIRQAKMNLELNLSGKGRSPKRLLRLELALPARKKVPKKCQKRPKCQKQTGSGKRKRPPSAKRSDRMSSSPPGDESKTEPGRSPSGIRRKERLKRKSVARRKAPPKQTRSDD